MHSTAQREVRRVNRNRVRVYNTAAGVNVYVEPGILEHSEWDFAVSYGRTAASARKVTHGDFIRDIYLKRNAHSAGTLALVRHFLEVISNAQGVAHFPPRLIQFDLDQVQRLRNGGLIDAGGMDLELLLVLFELVQIQEETNFPGGWLPTKLYTTVRDDRLNLECIAYLTEIAVPSNEHIREKVEARDKLLADLRRIVGT